MDKVPDALSARAVVTYDGERLLLTIYIPNTPNCAIPLTSMQAYRLAVDLLDAAILVDTRRERT